MSVAYSHPSIRLKGRPLGSVLIVAIGQGWLTYWAGWIVCRAEAISIFTRKGILGGLAITIITVGLYSLTQIYQIDSDRAKSNRTLAIWLGVRKSFLFSLICIPLAGVCMASLFWFYFRRPEGLVLLGYFVGLWAIVYRWERNYQSMNQMDNYNMVIRMNLVNSSCFAAYLALHFLHIL